MKSLRLAMLAIFSAMALILALFEYLLPPIVPVLPFAKVGISHIIILAVLIIMRWNDALIVFTIRSVFLAIFTGNPSMLLYSIPAGLISLVIMMTLLKTRKFSIPAISMASGSIHNLVQIIVAAAITGSFAVFAYLPYLMVFGAIAGLVTGMVCYLLIKKLPVGLYRVLTNREGINELRK